MESGGCVEQLLSRRGLVAARRHAPIARLGKSRIVL